MITTFSAAVMGLRICFFVIDCLKQNYNVLFSYNYELLLITIVVVMKVYNTVIDGTNLSNFYFIFVILFLLQGN